MEQTSPIILEYKPANSLGGAYWHGTVLGREMKFVRIIVGLALPALDRQAAAAIVLGELQRSFAPPDFTGLSAAVGTWPELKGALLEFCRDLKPDHIVVQDEQSRKLVWPITDSLVGASPVPALSYAAPQHALTELGRQNVEALIDHDQLHIGHLLDVMGHEPDQADRALRCAVNWALEFTAFYAGKKRGPLQLKRVFGTEGL
jgi:hypothetical protein